MHTCVCTGWAKLNCTFIHALQSVFCSTCNKMAFTRMFRMFRQEAQLALG